MRDQIQAAVDTFKSTINQIAMTEAQAAFTGTAKPIATLTAKAVNGKNGKHVVTAKAKPKARGKATVKIPEELAPLMDTVLEYVRANPNQSISEIGAALNQTSEMVRVPLTKLLELSHVKTTGQRRGTRYHAR